MTTTAFSRSESLFVAGIRAKWIVAAMLIGLVPALCQVSRPMTTVWPPRVVRDIEYARVGDISLKLDLYLPETSGPYRLMVWIHGGAFLGGDKGHIFWTPLPDLTQRGYAIASINYRLSSQATFPALVQDAKAAIRWLRANALKYEIKADRIVVGGESAGGYLSAMLGTTGDVAALENPAMGNPKESSRVQGVVDFFGPSNFLQMDAAVPGSCDEPMVHSAAESPESRLLGCNIRDCPEKVRAADPITYITADDPPFLIFHGTADCLVSPNQSQLLNNALKAAGVRSDIHLLHGLAHADRRFISPKTEEIVTDFLDSVLR